MSEKFKMNPFVMPLHSQKSIYDPIAPLDTSNGDEDNDINDRDEDLDYYNDQSGSHLFSTQYIEEDEEQLFNEVVKGCAHIVPSNNHYFKPKQ